MHGKFGQDREDYFYKSECKLSIYTVKFINCLWVEKRMSGKNL